MKARQLLLNYLRSQIHGPIGGEAEVLADPPYVRYLLGTLYPVNAALREIRDEDEEDGPSVSTAEEGTVDDPVQLAHEWMPSSVGLTFYFEGKASVTSEVWGARYRTIKEGRSRRWVRTQIAEASSPQLVELRRRRENETRTRQSVLEGRAQLDVFWRGVGDGWLVTVTLQNVQVKDEDAKLDPDLCLHQVGLRCRPSSGRIREYPSLSLLTADLEEQELRLLYRGAKVYAVGHGCAAVWKGEGSRGEIDAVATEFMPSHEVPPLTFDVGEHGDVLLLRRLADEHQPTQELATELEAFTGTYEAWVERIDVENKDVPPALTAARDRLLTRLRLAASTMRSGIRLLVSDPLVLRAFRLANRAMLMQMRHSKSDLGGGKRPRNEGSASATLDYEQLDYRWRPFQLAFQMLTLPSVSSQEDPDRDVVDLIWFPTGGGKTEAYLSIAATEIFLRRLRWQDEGAGTAVLTRYTLRLLTAQQFQRAAALICACELLRRRSPDTFGAVPISLGLWVGQAVVPNTFQEAATKCEEMLEEPEPQNRFQLEQCPWCGTEIVPRQHEEDRSAYGVHATAGDFRISCPSTRCVFHDRLPVSVVDEDLYANPPTMLIATVDKFARLAWEERAGSLFGAAGRRPPSLIIQDELHLLTGPLGTTVGVYEAAVDGLIRMRGGRPKILASTATIRRADDQVSGLFDRGVRLFPAAGLKAGDSFFAREEESTPGRLYVGVMAQSHTMAKTMVDVGAALLQAPVELGLNGADRDAYWTLVAYHNSLRELGRTVTQANDDIRARLITIAADHSRVRQLGDDDIVELTSNIGGDRLPALLARLGKTCADADAISLLATTSMLSVGVDVPRLGLMVVNGQPKTTAEYIQATSRVGRTAAVPGLVVTLFSATKARDRSHYEGFVGYHQALYRSVEPASVTPYSLPSRDRALHAALVILVRHGAGMCTNDSAGSIAGASKAVKQLLRLLEKRVTSVDEREAKAAKTQLERLLEEWGARAEEAKGLGRALYYVARSKQHASLLRDFGTAGPGWATLHSMRNVDRECPITVYGES